jgi:hypothetical protein
MTLHVSDKTQQLLLEEARRQRITPEELAEKLIQQGLRPKKRDLSHLAGTWTDEETRVFNEAVAPLQKVVEEDGG